MNLLKQTALILGLASLSLGGWTLFRDWRNKVSILFSTLCFVVAVWALSFVAHATLVGRLSYDIHLFCNVLLVPLTLELMARIFMRERDFPSRAIFSIAAAGSGVLAFMISFSLASSQAFRDAVLFWPVLILGEYAHILWLELRQSAMLRRDSISASKKIILYLGLGFTLAFCSFDHIPELGFMLPALGNLFFMLYLFFASQQIVPEKLFRLDALASRFFAVLTLSLMITGFFALLFPYISSSFPLFLLNSFLISFAVLALWGPLVTLFRFLGGSLFRGSREEAAREAKDLLRKIADATDWSGLVAVARAHFMRRFHVEALEMRQAREAGHLPAGVTRYLQTLREQGITPILYREILGREREQVLTRDRKEELDQLLGYLDFSDCDLVFPVFEADSIAGWIQIRESKGEPISGFAGFHQAIGILSGLSQSAVRILKIEEAREHDRLVLLGEMAAGLAHEVRNPLGAIRGAAELMNPQAEPWVRVIQEEVDRLNRLVGQFLDFARDPKEYREPVDLGELIVRILEQCRPGLPDGMTLGFERPAAAVRVTLVPDAVRQVLINLIQNSVQALEGIRQPSIRIAVFTTGFSVSDNGIGMSEETLSRAMEPFFTSFRNGTGLGLSICRNLVRSDDGKMVILSAPGKGTEVRVEYPNA
jgi:two-component system sensor histidine kinase HydH